MLTTRSRSLAAIASGALLLVALTACGGSDDTKDAKASTSSSSSPSASSSPTDASEGATDAATDGAADGEAAAPGERLTKANLVPTMLAAMREQKTAHMTMEIGSSVSADADVRYTSTGTEMKMAMDMGPTRAVVILVDGAIYMQQAKGSKFVKMSKDTPGVGDIIEQMSGLSPDSSVAAMKGALKSVEYAGIDTVAGEKVSKYRVTADTASMAQTFGQNSGLGNLPKSVTYTLYVDDAHLMRRFDMEISGQKITMTVTKWGEPVDIAAPPASQIMTQ